MKSVSVTKLRQKLPQYLSLANRGERVRVTSRSRTIAEIVPPPREGRTAEEARKRLRNSVLRFDDPLRPVFDPEEWDANR